MSRRIFLWQRFSHSLGRLCCVPFLVFLALAWACGAQAADTIDLPEKEFIVLKVEMINPSGDPTKSAEAQEGKNEFTFDSSAKGYCYIKCEAKLTPQNAETEAWAEQNVSWSMSPGISGSQMKWGDYSGGGFTEEDNKGELVWIQFSGLPSKSNELGLKVVKMTVLGQEATSNVEIFFSKNATNHPSNASNANWPNWMYYWLQTVTPLGTPAPTFTYGAGTFFTFGTTEITLSAGDAVSYSAAYGNNNPLQGIDNFAWTVIHESQHYKDCCDFWGNKKATWNNAKGKAGPDDDMDSDRIPNNVEDVNLNGVYDKGDLYDWQVLNTPTAGRPASIVNDFEDWNCQRHTNQTGEHSEDWSNPGMQHATNDKYND